MANTKRMIVLFLILLTIGCSKIKKTVGLTEEPTEDKEIAQKKLHDGDALVQSFTEKIAQPFDNGGFKRHEGLTETDPWDTQLKVEYKQDLFDEVLIVTSAGPDKEFSTTDDLSRTRKISNFWGVHRGLSGPQQLIIVWIISAILGVIIYCFLGSRRRSHGKTRKHPLVGAILVCVFGPLSLLLCCIVFVLSIFDIDFDFDIGDIEIDFD